MFSVDRMVPVGSAWGPTRRVVGSIPGRPMVVPALRKPVDDLEALAAAVGVMG